MRKSLPHLGLAATRHRMLRRISSFVILAGLFLSLIVMPVIAHAGGIGPVHASETLNVHEIDSADHKHTQGSDKDMPCHAVSHHHCSAALQLDAPRINLNTLGKGAPVFPGATTPLASRSQAPPLDPPLA
jgi:hypothetical protein